MSDKIEINVPVRADGDGFVSRLCPVCGKRFRIKPGDGSNLPLRFCPYCGHQGKQCWFTPAQSEYFRLVAKKVEIEQLAKIMTEHTPKLGGILSVETKVPDFPTPVPPDEPNDDWPIVLFECCNKRIKHDRSGATLHCVCCGKTKTIAID